MSGKEAKRERRRQKEAAREAARRRRRQQTAYTLVVIGAVIAVGAVLVAVSLDDPAPLAGQPPTVDEPAPPQAAACEPRPAPPQAGEDKPTFPDGPEPVLEEDADYRAVIVTSCGEVVVDLDARRAPQTVNSFVFLAQEGFFDGLRVFRNATGITVLQTGAGDDQATWDIGYTLPDELEAAEADGYPPGAVAMANAGPDTAGSQFFVVYGDGFTLEPTFTRFGTVTEGMDVLASIAAIEVEGEAGETPAEDVHLESVTIEVVPGG